MRLIFYYPLHAYSRIIRLMLTEKQLDFKSQYEIPWSLSEEALAISPFASLPIFQDVNGTILTGVWAIIEYLEEIYPAHNLIGRNKIQKSIIRQIANWFTIDFYHDVYLPILTEKVIKKFVNKKAPDPSIIRSTLYKMPKYFNYLSYLLKRKNWLCGTAFSLADISTVAFISILDYLSIIKWNNYDNVLQTWYVRIKSRPSFRAILMDSVPSLPKSMTYSKLDF